MKKAIRNENFYAHVDSLDFLSKHQHPEVLISLSDTDSDDSDSTEQMTASPPPPPAASPSSPPKNQPSSEKVEVITHEEFLDQIVQENEISDVNKSIPDDNDDKDNEDEEQEDKRNISFSPSSTEERKFKCDICDKSFRQKNHLSWHMRSHSTTICEKCGASFSGSHSNFRVSRHIKSCSGFNSKSHKCPICDKSYKFASYLDRHMKSCGIVIKCEKCDKVFKTRQGLRLHLCPVILSF